MYSVIRWDVKTMSHWREAMNIGDIAEMAGVSRAAVSRYLNHGYISEEKKERIRKVVEETGYKPSIMAQTLRTKKTRLIGVILPRINSDSISSVVEGITDELARSGYETLLATTANDPEKEIEYLKVFSRNRVDGVILLATVFTEEHKRILREISIPVVVVGQRLAGYSCIYHDDFNAGHDITRIILEVGRRHLAYIGVLKEDVAVGTHRFEGFSLAVSESGLSVKEEQTAIADFSIESGYQKMGELLDRSLDIDAVVCATDKIAIGAVRCLKERGKRVPQDVAVAGFGDNTASAVTSPSITTVHFHYKESGIQAAGIIMEQLTGKAVASAEIKLGYEIVKRQSTSDPEAG